MTLRRRIAVGDASAPWFVHAAYDDFSAGFFGQELFPSVEAAAKAWPACRREVWAVERRMNIPRAARVFDGLSRRGWDLQWMRNGYGAVRLPLSDVLAALDADRAAVAAFERRDHTGAKAIADYLAMWREDLDAIERHARTEGGHGLGFMSPGDRYGAAWELGPEWTE